MERPLKIIVIEDDPMVLELHKQFVLKMPEYTLVGCAANGEEGLTLIAEAQPELAIVDIYMPGVTGLQLLRQIRSSGLSTDVILVTAAHDTESIQQGIQYGAVDYVIKPFTYRRLRKSLLSYLQYYGKLHTCKRMSQKEVDLLKEITQDRESIGLDLPKGLQESTLNLILGLLEKMTGFTSVSELSQTLGISRVTIRRYVNYLKDTGFLQETLSYGPAGRPSQKFMVHQR